MVSGEAVAGAALALTVFCMVLGSSSVPLLLGPGRKLRWLAFLGFAAVAFVLAVRSRGARPERPVVIAAALGGWVAVLGLVSTAWTVDPRLTFGRAVSFAIVLAAGSALAYATVNRPRLPSRLLYGALAGTTLVALVGAVMVVVAHGDAVKPALRTSAARYQGLGENPDTVAMLEGLVVPIALWAVLRARRMRDRICALSVLVILLVSISASGSRGGLLAMTVGGIVFSLALPFAWRRRLVVLVAVCCAAFAATVGTQIPKPLSAPAPASAPASAPPTAPAKTVHVSAAPPSTQDAAAAERRYGGRLTDELFRGGGNNMRSLFTSSGRLDAWYEGIKLANARPLLGYGFGTEASVFVDRISTFEGDYVENSLIGFYIQLGAVGLVSLAALLLSLVSGIARATRRSGQGADGTAAPIAGVVAAGLALMLVQSYVYSVGNVATVTLWTAAFVGTALACPPGRRAIGLNRSQERSTVAA